MVLVDFCWCVFVVVLLFCFVFLCFGCGLFFFVVVAVFSSFQLIWTVSVIIEAKVLVANTVLESWAIVLRLQRSCSGEE